MIFKNQKKKTKTLQFDGSFNKKSLLGYNNFAICSYLLHTVHIELIFIRIEPYCICVPSESGVNGIWWIRNRLRLCKSKQQSQTMDIGSMLLKYTGLRKAWGARISSSNAI